MKVDSRSFRMLRLNRFMLSSFTEICRRILIGFDVTVDEKTGVCMLIASEEDAETVGLKRANVVTFTTLQYPGFPSDILSQLSETAEHPIQTARRGTVRFSYPLLMFCSFRQL